MHASKGFTWYFRVCRDCCWRCFVGFVFFPVGFAAAAVVVLVVFFFVVVFIETKKIIYLSTYLITHPLHFCLPRFTYILLDMYCKFTGTLSLSPSPPPRHHHHSPPLHQFEQWFSPSTLPKYTPQARNEYGGDLWPTSSDCIKYKYFV